MNDWETDRQLLEQAIAAEERNWTGIFVGFVVGFVLVLVLARLARLAWSAGGRSVKNAKSEAGGG